MKKNSSHCGWVPDVTKENLSDDFWMIRLVEQSAAKARKKSR
jgi:hypothetical protein